MEINHRIKLKNIQQSCDIVAVFSSALYNDLNKNCIFFTNLCLYTNTVPTANQTSATYTLKICINVFLALADAKAQKEGLWHDLQRCDIQYTVSLKGIRDA